MMTISNKGRFRIKIVFGIVISIAIYILALLPVSGFVGGLVYFCGAPIFPSLLNLLFTCLAVSFIKPRVWQYVLFLPISFGLAVNVEAPTLLNYLFHPPAIEENILHKANLDSGREIYIDGTPDTIPNGYFMYTNPLALRVSLSTSLVSGSWFWSKASGGAFDGLSSYVEKASGKVVAYGTGVQEANTYVSTLAEQHKDNPLMFDLTVNIIEGTDTIAFFRLKNAPGFKDDFVTDNAYEILNASFAKNIFHMLSHGTFWTPLVTWVMNKDLHSFLQKSL